MYFVANFYWVENEDEVFLRQKGDEVVFVRLVHMMSFLEKC